MTLVEQPLPAGGDEARLPQRQPALAEAVITALTSDDAAAGKATLPSLVGPQEARRRAEIYCDEVLHARFTLWNRLLTEKAHPALREHQSIEWLRRHSRLTFGVSRARWRASAARRC